MAKFSMKRSKVNELRKLAPFECNGGLEFFKSSSTCRYVAEHFADLFRKKETRLLVAVLSCILPQMRDSN
jgi:hypothetical protein